MIQKRLASSALRPLTKYTLIAFEQNGGEHRKNGRQVTTRPAPSILPMFSILYAHISTPPRGVEVSFGY